MQKIGFVTKDSRTRTDWSMNQSCPATAAAEDPGRSGFAGTRKRGNNGTENEGAISAERFADRHQRSFKRNEIPMNHRTASRVQRVVRG
jgi:hypothetical protein